MDARVSGESDGEVVMDSPSNQASSLGKCIVQVLVDVGRRSLVHPLRNTQTIHLQAVLLFLYYKRRRVVGGFNDFGDGGK